MFLKRLKDGTLAAWCVVAVDIHNGRKAYSLHARSRMAVEAMHAQVRPGAIAYCYLATGPDLEDLLDMREASLDARYEGRYEGREPAYA